MAAKSSQVGFGTSLPRMSPVGRVPWPWPYQVVGVVREPAVVAHDQYPSFGDAHVEGHGRGRGAGCQVRLGEGFPVERQGGIPARVREPVARDRQHPPADADAVDALRIGDHGDVPAVDAFLAGQFVPDVRAARRPRRHEIVPHALGVVPPGAKNTPIVTSAARTVFTPMTRRAIAHIPRLRAGPFPTLPPMIIRLGEEYVAVGHSGRPPCVGPPRRGGGSYLPEVYVPNLRKASP